MVPLSKARERESYGERREATRRNRSEEERRGGPGLMAAVLLTDEPRLWVILLGPNRGGAWGWIERRSSLVGSVVKTRRRWILFGSSDGVPEVWTMSAAAAAGITS